MKQLLVGLLLCSFLSVHADRRDLSHRSPKPLQRDHPCHIFTAERGLFARQSTTAGQKIFKGTVYAACAATYVVGQYYLLKGAFAGDQD